MASMQKLYPAVMTFILAALVLGIGLTVTLELRDTTLDSTTDDITLLNGTAVSLTNTGVRSTTFTLTNSSGTTLGSGNYTLAATAGTVTLTDNTYNNTNWTASYDYGEDEVAYTATDSTLDALADFPDWFPILVVVIMAAIIIGIVIRGFSGGSGL